MVSPVHIVTLYCIYRVVGREGLCTAARKSISILEESVSLHFQKIDVNSPIFRALDLFRTFLAELERIDTQAQLTAGWYQV